MKACSINTDADFQRRYRKYWAMRFPSKEFVADYFAFFEKHKTDQGLSPESVCQALREHPSVEFSFATKMAHMVNTDLPLYDEMVRQFFSSRGLRAGAMTRGWPCT